MTLGKTCFENYVAQFNSVLLYEGLNHFFVSDIFLYEKRKPSLATSVILVL